MKHTALLAAIAALLIANQSANAQGALTPPGAPAESQKSLQEIYDAIQSAKAEFATLVQQAVPSVPGMVTVLGGRLPQNSELAGKLVSTFYIGKYEVTWGEWKEVRDWAVANGYSDLSGVGGVDPEGSPDNFPVGYVTWYDVLKWLNAKSQKEGLTPVYLVQGEIYKTGSNISTASESANGYRLPSEAEWEWAARGGVKSSNFIYSGSNDPLEVAWCWENSSDGSKAVGTKASNELSIHDMSGNVWEWVSGPLEGIPASAARMRGGSVVIFGTSCNVTYRGGYNDRDRPYSGLGFRLARSY
jgi:formylglycine-generating enzyme required for sulfatase activity